MEHLEGNIPFQPEIGGEIDGGHASAREFGTDGVAVVHQRSNETVRDLFLHLTILILQRKGSEPTGGPDPYRYPGYPFGQARCSVRLAG
ncbi:MAG: hypothetical protein NVS2B15_03470 [Pseudarthrobacter sp.]